MPRVTPLAEVQDLEPDQEIILVRGKITKIYKASRSKDPNEPWSFQNMTLRDNTGERKVLLKNRSDEIPMNWRGKDIIIEAHKGEKGWSGVYAYDEEYPKDSGKFARIIKVTPTAGVFLADERSEGPAQPAQATAPNGQRAAQAPRGDAGTTAPVSDHQNASGDKIAGQRHAVIEAKKQAARLANLFTIAVDAVDAIITPHFGDESINAITDEQHQAAIGHIFGCLQRAGKDIDLPLKPLAQFFEELEQKPEPPPPPPKPVEPPPKPTPPPPAKDLGWDDDEIPF